MDPLDGTTEERAPGLTRRQLLCRVGGGAAGAMLASLALEMGLGPAAAAGAVSLRDLLRWISDKGCDPSQGIRVAPPDDHPVISIRSVDGRYANSVVNDCQPLQFSMVGIAAGPMFGGIR
jgi:hypothetical protein